MSFIEYILLLLGLMMCGFIAREIIIWILSKIIGEFSITLGYESIWNT